MIRFEKVSKQFGAFKALVGLDLLVRKGQVTVLLGPNGAGKTTTLRLATGYFGPDQGKVLIDGQADVASCPELRRRIGYLPENNPLYGDMTLYEHLALAASVRGLSGQSRSQALAEVLERCQLLDVVKERVSILSKGYRQRLGLALALLGKPDLLVLDEPTTGLDPLQIARFGTLVQELGLSHTILISTHQLDQALCLGQELLVLAQGQLVFSGDAIAFSQAAASPQARLETSALPEQVETCLQNLAFVREVRHQLSSSGWTYRLTGNFGPGQLNMLYQRVQHLPLSHFGAEPADLHDCFAALLGRVQPCA